MTLYTKTGDSGTTSLLCGVRVPKNHPRIEALGALDEAVATIAVARSASADSEVVSTLRYLQHKLLVCAGMLAYVDEEDLPQTRISPLDVSALEDAIDRFDSRTERAGLFVIEGECPASAAIDLARTVVRRAERRVVDLSQADAVDAALMAFVNRTSDALYACAGIERQRCGRPSEPWNPAATL